MEIQGMTQELYNKLTALAREYFTQDNRSTRYPIYFQVEYEIRTDDMINQAETCYIIENSYIDTIADLFEYCNDYEIKLDRDFEWGDEIEGLTTFYYHWTKEYKRFFFTAKECENYIMLNRHNMSEARNARSYCQYGGDKTDELEIIVELLRCFYHE